MLKHIKCRITEWRDESVFKALQERGNATRLLKEDHNRAVQRFEDLKARAEEIDSADVNNKAKYDKAAEEARTEAENLSVEYQREQQIADSLSKEHRTKAASGSNVGKFCYQVIDITEDKMELKRMADENGVTIPESQSFGYEVFDTDPKDLPAWAIKEQQDSIPVVDANPV